MEISLYPDQKEFLGKLRSVWKSSNRILAVCPTGYGKTRVASAIIKGYTDRGLRVCFLVPRISLIKQTADSFSELGLTDITYIWRDYDTDEKAKITISSIDSYTRRAKRDFDLVIYDEAHHARKTVLKWMEEYPEDRYLGLTATPFAEWMGKYYDVMVKSKSMKWLIENKRLSPYEVFAPQIPDTSKAKKQMTSMGYDYAESDLEAIMGDSKVVGNVLQHWLTHGEGRLTIGLCVNVNHANFLTVEFCKAGVNAAVITADTPVEERQVLFDKMKDGILKVIFSVNCLTEGFDLPEVSCLINARPTKSKARYIQGMGRALRYMPNKTALIFDHSGTTLDLGLPCDIEIEDLNDKDLKENKSQRQVKEKAEKKPKKCPKCDFLKEAGQYVCPKCGFKPISGEDVETDESIKLEKIKGDKKTYTMEEKQAFYSGLLGYQKKRKLEGKSCSDGYLAHTYKAKFSVWPKGLRNIAKEPSVEVLNFIKSKQIAFAKSKGKK